MKNEAHARIKINQLLTEAGWMYKAVELASVGGAMAVGAVVYASLLILFGGNEWREVLEEVRNRRGRGKQR